MELVLIDGTGTGHPRATMELVLIDETGTGMGTGTPGVSSGSGVVVSGVAVSGVVASATAVSSTDVSDGVVSGTVVSLVFCVSVGSVVLVESPPQDASITTANKAKRERGNICCMTASSGFPKRSV